jgi:parallel beta-helix repeat protein
MPLRTTAPAISAGLSRRALPGAAATLALTLLGVPGAVVAGGQDTAPECVITNYGAVADDGAADTIAIQAAIDACKGTGGRVVVPAGLWHTGGLTLGSDMQFDLLGGAVLKLIPDIEQMITITHDGPRSDGPRKYHVAIYAPHAQNLIINGPGKIDGSGPDFWDKDFYSLNIGRPTLPRPEPTMELADCRNSHVRGVRFENLASFALMLNRCDGVSVVDVSIYNDPRSPNTDGIQIADTVNAFITRADIRTGDDAIVVKSYRRVVDNLVVTDSYVESDDGAIKFGTQVYKGIQNTLFSNIVINNSRYGISLFQVDGSFFRNNRFENFVIRTGGRHERHYPLVVDIDRRTPEGEYGSIEGVVFSDISIDTGGAALISGNRNAPIRNLTLSNINIMTPDKVFPLARSGNKPSGNKGIKRDQQSENYARVPAHVVLANIEGLVVDGMVIDQRDQAEPRSALALIKVTNAVVDGVTTATTAEPILDSGSRNVTLGRVTNFAVPAAP